MMIKFLKLFYIVYSGKILKHNLEERKHVLTSFPDNTKSKIGT